jgi:hypothetical protein
MEQISIWMRQIAFEKYANSQKSSRGLIEMMLEERWYWVVRRMTEKAGIKMYDNSFETA